MSNDSHTIIRDPEVGDHIIVLSNLVGVPEGTLGIVMKVINMSRGLYDVTVQTGGTHIFYYHEFELDPQFQAWSAHQNAVAGTFPSKPVPPPPCAPPPPSAAPEFIGRPAFTRAVAAPGKEKPKEEAPKRNILNIMKF